MLSHVCVWCDVYIYIYANTTYMCTNMFIYVYVYVPSPSPSIYRWVMSQIWMSHVTYMNESCHPCFIVRIYRERDRLFLLHTPTDLWCTLRETPIHINVTHMNASCHTCAWVISHIWMSNVTHMNASCHACTWHAYECLMSHLWIFFIFIRTNPNTGLDK